jgi:hypothetical protein
VLDVAAMSGNHEAIEHLLGAITRHSGRISDELCAFAMHNYAVSIYPDRELSMAKLLLGQAGGKELLQRSLQQQTKAIAGVELSSLWELLMHQGCYLVSDFAPRWPGAKSQNPFHWIASQRGAEDPQGVAIAGDSDQAAWVVQIQDACRAWLRSGFDPNEQDSWGRTPLHIAVENGCAAVVQALLESGADPRQTDRSGCLPEDVARQADCADIAHMLSAMRVRHAAQETIKKIASGEAQIADVSQPGAQGRAVRGLKVR